TTRVRDGANSLCAPYRHVGACLKRFTQLNLAERTHHEQPHILETGLPELHCLAGTRDRQPTRPPVECGAGTRRSSVAIAVGLHIDPQLNVVSELGARASAVTPDH